MMQLRGASILLVEDELHLAAGLRANLEAEGHEVTHAATGPAGLAQLTAQPPQFSLAILDVMLPGMDGLTVCAQARAAGAVLPIFFLSAKATPQERALGLRMGGDDYLGKPFDLDEFLSRVLALLRRHRARPSPVAPVALAGLGVAVDFDRFQLLHADGRTEDVPSREMAILRLLCRRSGEVVSREDILDEAWGFDVYPSSRTVDNFIVRLRRRLEPDPSAPRFLHTVRGVGYRLDAASTGSKHG